MAQLSISLDTISAQTLLGTEQPAAAAEKKDNLSLLLIA
jgi:hypothetical protein